MAFPWITDTNFEDGTQQTWNSREGTDPTFAHYSELARTPGLPMPFRGAYCMRVNPADITSFLQELTDFDMTVDSDTIYVRFYFFATEDLAMSDGENFTIFQVQSTGAVAQAVATVHFTDAAGFQIGVGQTGATTTLAPFLLGKWTSIEMFIDLQTSSNGAIDWWIDGHPKTQVAGLSQLTTVAGRLGKIGGAEPTAGEIFFDQFIADDARIFPIRHRWPDQLLLTLSGHAFVGPGKVRNVSLLGATVGDCRLKIWDTDVADTDRGNPRVEITTTAVQQMNDPATATGELSDGCYVELSGTNPRALVQLSRAVGYGDEAALRNHGLSRLAA